MLTDQMFHRRQVAMADRRHELTTSLLHVGHRAILAPPTPSTRPPSHDPHPDAASSNGSPARQSARSVGPYLTTAEPINAALEQHLRHPIRGCPDRLAGASHKVRQG